MIGLVFLDLYSTTTILLFEQARLFPLHRWRKQCVLPACWLRACKFVRIFHHEQFPTGCRSGGAASSARRRAAAVEGRGDCSL